jgi:hypothetical protein
MQFGLVRSVYIYTTTSGPGTITLVLVTQQQAAPLNGTVADFRHAKVARYATFQHNPVQTLRCNIVRSRLY